MIIKIYTTEYRQDCLAIFDSNCPKYFDVSEKKLLINWLNGLDSGIITYKNVASIYFYVLIHNGDAIACGGFYILQDKNIANMVWGMVHAAHHGNGFGKALFEYRIQQIKALFTKHAIVLDTSQHTFTFFKKLGFKVTNISPNGYGKGLGRYDMILLD
jgi:[ribosomal protein S18]-alanine N-acetyltransferase